MVIRTRLTRRPHRRRHVRPLQRQELVTMAHSAVLTRRPLAQMVAQELLGEILPMEVRVRVIFIPQHSFLQVAELTRQLALAAMARLQGMPLIAIPRAQPLVTPTMAPIVVPDTIRDVMEDLADRFPKAAHGVHIQGPLIIKRDLCAAATSKTMVMTASTALAMIFITPVVITLSLTTCITTVTATACNHRKITNLARHRHAITTALFGLVQSFIGTVINLRPFRFRRQFSRNTD